jgi:WXG100 protein secretion system (Wss), protein YukD
MSTLRITVSGPARKVDLAIAGDAPIGELVPALVEVAGPQAGYRPPGVWTLGPPGRRPLPAHRTLADCGIVHGALLNLRCAGELGLA